MPLTRPMATRVWRKLSHIDKNGNLHRLCPTTGLHVKITFRRVPVTLAL